MNADVTQMNAEKQRQVGLSFGKLANFPHNSWIPAFICATSAFIRVPKKFAAIA